MTGTETETIEDTTPSEDAQETSGSNTQDGPKQPFTIGASALVAMCLGSGLVGGLTVLVGLSYFGYGGSAAPGSQAATLHQLGIAPQPILPSASEIHSNAMTGQPMRGPWPAAEFRAPASGEAITPQSALPRSIGSLDAVSDALQNAANPNSHSNTAE